MNRTLKIILALPVIALVSPVCAQTPAPANPRPAFPGAPSPEERQRLQQLTNEDHAAMLAQLGIAKLRPGYNGNTTPGTPNQANYDQAKANPYPDYPDVLTLKSGRKVTSPEVWRNSRRAGIAEDFEREVVGRVPKNVPGVTGRGARTVETKAGARPGGAKPGVG